MGMVVPRGGPAHADAPMQPHQVPPPPPPPPNMTAASEPSHWGYGPWSSMPAPPPSSGRHHGQGVKRHFNESDDCDDAFSEESSKDHCSSPGDGTDTPHMLTRKKRRGIIEKRRRDRINTSLTELRRLVPTAYEKQGSAKLEKAEILQLTVDHLKMIHAKGLDTLAYDPSKYAMDYHNIGFRECATEVARYLETVEGMNGRDPLRERLLSHLQYFAAQREYAAKSPAAPAHHGAPPPPPPGWYGHHHHAGAPPPPPAPGPPSSSALPPASHHYPPTTSPHQQQQQQQQQAPPPPPSHNNNNYETSAATGDGIKSAAEADAAGLVALSSAVAASDYHHHQHHEQQRQQHHHRSRDDYRHQQHQQLHSLQTAQSAPQPPPPPPPSSVQQQTPSGYHHDAMQHQQQQHHDQQQYHQTDSSVSAQMKPYRPWGAEVAY